MITGYNTDVRYKERVLHVQTEDKGVANPFIESVVYLGGQVLVAKRASYGDLVQQGGGTEAISARMDQQHRMMIAAIRAGKLDGKMREVLGPEWAPDVTVAAPVDRSKLEAPNLLDATRDDPGGPSLDQVILEYLTHEAQKDRLELELVNGSGLPKAGQTGAVRLRARSSKSGLGVAGAQVSVRMISTVRDPQMLAEGVTDDEGLLTLSVSVPTLERGAAALIVTASSVVGTAEIKHLL